MNWKEHLTREEIEQLQEIERQRADLTAEYRRIYDRCRKRRHEKDGAVAFMTGRGDVFFVDREDAEWVARHRWQSVGSGASHPDRDPYVANTLKGKRAYLHRIVTDAPDGVFVDHIDGDTLNNRRSNLRLVTHSENMKYRTERVKKRGNGLGVNSKL